MLESKGMVTDANAARAPTHGQEGGGIGAAPGGPDDRVLGCGADYLKALASYAAASGMPLARQDSGVRQSARCREIGGNILHVQFDLVAYLSRGMVEQPAAVHKTLQRMKEFVDEEFTAEDLAQVVDGTAVCAPQSCREPDEIVRIAVCYFACMAQAACSGAHLLEMPLAHELNVTMLGDGRPTVDLPLDPRAGGGTTDFIVPYFLKCHGEPTEHNADWRRWGKLLQSVPGYAATPLDNSSLLDEADRLLDLHMGKAQQWVTWVAHFTDGYCGSEHMHFERELARPASWQLLEAWKAKTGFCPHGFLVALFLRGFAKRALGLLASAAEDFRRARVVMGACEDPPWMSFRDCAAALVPGAREEGAALPTSGGCEDRLLVKGARLVEVPPLVKEEVTGA